MPDAKVRIVGEDATGAAWAQAISTAQGAADRMRSLFTGAFAGISVGSIGLAVNTALELGAALENASIKAGVSAGTFAEMAAASREAGIDTETLSNALKKMELFVSQAASGGKEQTLALEVMGVKLKDIIGLAPDKMFEVLGEAIAQLGNDTDRTRELTDVFGRSGTVVLPLFTKLGETFAQTRAHVKELGQALDDEGIKKLAEADRSVKSLEQSFGTLWTTLISKVAPGIKTFGDELSAQLSGSRVAQITAQIERIKTELSVKEGEGGVAHFIEAVGGHSESRLRARLDALEKELAQLKGATAAAGAGGAYALPDSAAPPSKFGDAEAQARRAEEEAKKFKEDMKDIEKANTEFFASLAKQGVEQSKVEKEALDQWLAAYEKRKTEEEKTADDIAALRKTSLNAAFQAVETFREASKTALDDFLLHGQFTFRKLGTYLLESLAVKELNKALNGVFDAIEGYIAKSGSGGSGGGSWISTIMSFFSFASGGSFDVGGHGGNDSQLVSFMATPGEHVTVGSGGDGAGGNLNFNPVYHIDARGADAERIMSIMPSLLTQTAEKAKRDVLEAFRRNNLPHPPRA